MKNKSDIISLIHRTKCETYRPERGFAGAVRIRPQGLDQLSGSEDDDLDRNTQVLISYGTPAQVANGLANFAPGAEYIVRRSQSRAAAYLVSISVADPLQNMGLGELLLHKSLDCLTKLRVERVFLHAAGDTTSQAKRLQHWYSRNGFERLPQGDKTDVRPAQAFFGLWL